MTVPDGWKESRITNIAKVILGQSPPSSCYNKDCIGLPFLQGNTEFGSRSPSASVWASQITKEAREGDVLLTVRAPVGEVNIADQSYCIGRGVSALRPISSTPEFLFYSMQYAATSLESLAQGSTFTAITGKDLRAVTLALPPLPEQKKIAAILSSVDETIQATQETIEQTKKVKQGLMQELLTRGIGHTRFKNTEIGEIPDTWVPIELNSIAEPKRGSFSNGPFGSDLLTSELRDTGVAVIYIRDIKDASFNFVSQVYVSQNKAESLPYCHCLPQDILIAKVGDPPGNACLYPKGLPLSIITQDVIRLRVNRQSYSPQYITFYLNSPMFKNQVQRIMIEGTRTRVSLTEFKKLCIPVPPISEQHHIVDILASIDDRLQIEETDLQQLYSLKKGLMQDLLTGKVRVAV